MKVSVIVPAFNSKNRIEKCLNSLLRQDFLEFEIIVVDDGSTDSTAATAKKLNVKVFSKLNQGPAIARNFGAQKAGGKILVFIDDDCIAEKSWLSEMIRPFVDEKVAGVQGAYKTMQKELCARFVQLEIEDRYDRLKKAKNLDWIGSYSAAYRRDVFFEMNGFDEKFPTASGEDPELSFKISKAGHKIVFNPKAIVFHSHANNFSDYFKKKFFRAYWRVLLYKKHSDKIAGDSYTPQTLKLQILVVFAFFLALAMAAINLNFVIILEFIFVIVLFATAIPFSIKAAKKDFEVGMISPVIIFGRTVVFCFGLVWGMISGVWRK